MQKPNSFFFFFLDKERQQTLSGEMYLKIYKRIKHTLMRTVLFPHRMLLGRCYGSDSSAPVGNPTVRKPQDERGKTHHRNPGAENAVTGEAPQRPLLDRAWRPTPACLSLRTQPPARAQHPEALKAVSLPVNRVHLFLFLFSGGGGEGQTFPLERFLPLIVPAEFALSCCWTFLEFVFFSQQMSQKRCKD